MIARWLRRRMAEAAIDEIDADVARWYVEDGQLSEEPLSGPLTEWGKELRERRLAAVARLEAAGGRDPHPSFLRPPSEAQRAHRRTVRELFDRGVHSP